MLRLIRYVVLLGTLFIILETSAVILGRSLPVRPGLAMLHLSDCALPCWIGIIPGKTTLLEARKQIQEVFGKSPDYRIVFSNEAPPVALYVRLEKLNVGVVHMCLCGGGDGRIYQIAFYLDVYESDSSSSLNAPITDPITFAELFGQIGLPTRSNLPENFGDETLFAFGDEISGAIVFFPSNANIGLRDSPDMLVMYGGGQIPVNIEYLHMWSGKFQK
jgi:hypothetical protein